MTKKTTDLTAAAPTGFAIVDQPGAGDVMRSAFDELGVTEDLLQRIKVPTGGMTAFMVEELEGETVQQALEVILIAVKGRQKAWWSTPMDEGGGGSPPSCTSKDGLHGFGNNTLNEDEPDTTRVCNECAWSKFGSARGGGAGKDCSDYSMLFFFRQGSRMPSLLQVPATSLKSLQSYILRLIDSGKRYESIVTTIGLEQAKSKGGITYSRLKFSFKSDLSAEAAEAMKGLAEQFSKRINQFDNFAAADSNA